ncbi:MAG: hypothetical protein PHQ12_14360 [Chthoniobacteraceae bacterium]|nr:hypothetical protein [Chthoniobacteraceae bacterium]
MKNATPDPRPSHPFSIGLHAARANLVPGLIVQAAMAAVLLGYFFYPPARAWLEELARLKERWGYGFACGAGMLAGAVVPELLVIVIFQRGRVHRSNWSDLLFGLLYWGSQSMVVDAFYRFQAVLFGTHPDLLTVAKKVIVDQFIYTPLYSMPFAMVCFTWKNNGYRWEGMRRVFTLRFYREVTIPSIIAAWGVWIPVVSMVYSLPPLLQVPLFSLALTFWSMMLTWITRQKK